MRPPDDDSSERRKAADRVLAFAHIGDLHITDAKQRNFADFLAIAAQIEVECGRLIDFVLLPGDNADNGTTGAICACRHRVEDAKPHRCISFQATTIWSKAASMPFTRGLAQICCPRR